MTYVLVDHVVSEHRVEVRSPVDAIMHTQPQPIEFPIVPDEERVFNALIDTVEDGLYLFMCPRCCPRFSVCGNDPLLA
jgi:hypothetical protein